MQWCWRIWGDDGSWTIDDGSWGEFFLANAQRNYVMDAIFLRRQRRKACVKDGCWEFLSFGVMEFFGNL